MNEEQSRVHRPFSPTIIEYRVPKRFLDIINMTGDAILPDNGLSKKFDFSDNLVGKVSKEVRIPVAEAEDRDFMANVIKNNVVAAGTSLGDIIGAVDSNHEVIVLMLRATNIDGTNDATVDVKVTKSSGSAMIAKTMSVPADTSLDVLGTSKLVLMATDKLEGLASATSDIEFFVSYLEITD